MWPILILDLNAWTPRQTPRIQKGILRLHHSERSPLKKIRKLPLLTNNDLSQTRSRGKVCHGSQNADESLKHSHRRILSIPLTNWQMVFPQRGKPLRKVLLEYDWQKPKLVTLCIINIHYYALLKRSLQSPIKENNTAYLLSTFFFSLFRSLLPYYYFLIAHIDGFDSPSLVCFARSLISVSLLLFSFEC